MAKMYITTYKEPLFVHRKVKTALFEGTHLELVESVSEILGVQYLPNNTFGYFYEVFNEIFNNPSKIPHFLEHSFHTECSLELHFLIKNIPDFQKNATISPKYEVHAGIKDNTKFGQIISWKGQKELSVWGEDSCNSINGSDTTVYSPMVTKDTILRYLLQLQ